MSESAHRGEVLPYVLERNASRGAQIGCTFVLALLLGGIGAGLLVAAIRSDERVYIIYGAGGLLAFLGLFLLYAAIQQTFALATPQTIVEIDATILRPRAKVTLYFRQPGPASFESLRANLVGEESWSVRVGNNRTSHKTRDLGTHNLFDSGPFEVSDAQPYEATVTVEIPEVQRAERGHAERWQLEVWGKVRGRADFQHVFPVELE